MTKEQESLLKYANDSTAFGGPGLTWEAIAEQLSHPAWSPSERWSYTWEECVPDSLQEIWHELPVEAQIMARIMAGELMEFRQMYQHD